MATVGKTLPHPCPSERPRHIGGHHPWPWVPAVVVGAVWAAMILVTAREWGTSHWPVNRLQSPLLPDYYRPRQLSEVAVLIGGSTLILVGVSTTLIGVVRRPAGTRHLNHLLTVWGCVCVAALTAGWARAISELLVSDLRVGYLANAFGAVLFAGPQSALWAVTYGWLAPATLAVADRICPRWHTRSRRDRRGSPGGGRASAAARGSPGWSSWLLGPVLLALGHAAVLAWPHLPEPWSLVV